MDKGYSLELLLKVVEEVNAIDSKYPDDENSRLDAYMGIARRSPSFGNAVMDTIGTEDYHKMCLRYIETH